MHSYVKQLKEAGFNNIESKTYLALLEIGNGSVIEIAKKASIPRTSVYNAIAGLSKYGLVNESYDDFGKKVYVAGAPEKILNFLSIKKDSFTQILPVLSNIFLQQKSDSKMEVYPIDVAFRKMSDIVLSSPKGSTLLSIGDSLLFKKEFAISAKEVKTYFMKRLKKRIRTKAITSSHYFSNNVKNNFTRETNQKELREMRFFPNIKKFGFFFQCIRDYVCIRHSSFDNYEMILKNQELATVFGDIYEHLWNTAEEIPE